METTKIQALKRIVLPDQFLERNKLKEGDLVAFFISGNNLIIKPVKMEVITG